MSKHMMLSPEAFLSGFTDSSYEKLIVERDSLIADIKKHEEKEKKRDRSGKEWDIDPEPDVVYQCDLECLVQLCLLMNEKYNREYIWGDKRFDMNNGTEKTKTLTMPDINMDIEIEEEEPDIESGSVDYPIEMEMDGFRVIHDHIDGQPIYDVYDSENHHIGTVHSKSAVSELNEQLEEEESYPVKLQVDGYDVNHYHEGDIPVYEIYDKDGNVMDVAHSTNEMHEITGNGKI